MKNNGGHEFEYKSMDLAAPSLQIDKGEPYLVDRLILGGDSANVVLSAYTGTGKTTLMLGLAICMAQGRPAWDKLHIPKPLKVVYIDQEIVPGQIIEIARNISEVYGTPMKGMLTAISGTAEAFSIEKPHSLRSLLEKLHRIRPDFVFLDGWQWFIEGKISDWEVVGKALSWWKEARREIGFGLCIIHHNKKTGDPRYKPKNPLEMAAGTQSLMDQARTKLIYEHLPGYEDYGLLYGRCSKAEWNPVRIVLEYDAETQSHRVVGDDETRYMFDKKTIKFMYGEADRTERVNGLLNRLNACGYRDSKVAQCLGVSRVTVSKWRSGVLEPSDERIRQLEELLGELEGNRVTKG